MAFGWKRLEKYLTIRYNESMAAEFYSATCIRDAVSKEKRRSRHILAASGLELESGEFRDLDKLYVMGFDGKLYKISDLNQNPDKQTEDYTVKAQADHGEEDPETGLLIPTIEKQFGSCRVWLDDNGQLHAKMYFADDDALADHAWAISEDASYSIGVDWVPDGITVAGNEITEPIGILREISMVLTGNDPRAKTIDTKKGKAQGRAVGDNIKDAVDGADKAQGSKDVADKAVNNESENTMADKTTKDNLTPDESEAIKRQLGERIAEAVDTVVEDFTTSASESETEPTARDTKDTEGEGEKAGEKAEDKTTDKALHNNIVIIKDRAVKQERTSDKADWRKSIDAKKAFAELAYKNQGFGGSFASQWKDMLVKNGATTKDGITGLGLPVDGEQIVIDALEKSDGLISRFQFIGGKTYLVRLLTATEGNDAESARAGGHLKGDTKLFQELTNNPRQFYNVPVYKKLDIDYLELYENPELVDFRARELVEARIVEIERAMVIGDGRSAPDGNNPDRRMFRGGRGFYSMVADATDMSGEGSTAGVGQLFATALSLPAGTNMVDAAINAEGELRADGRRIMVAKKSLVTGARTARLGADGTGDYLIPRGVSVEDAFGVERVYAPAWMDNADVDFVMFVENTPKLIGMNPASPDMKSFFDTTTNTDVLMAEGPNGGGLAAYKAAVVVKIGNASA